jgi:7-keto-8-aminopelargonate synthetase-like enzyme
LVDACRLSGANLHRFPHNDLAALDHLLRTVAACRRTLVVVDGVYSMAGDCAPLARLAALCRRHGAALLVDEAHALGVLGRRGTGSAEHAGVAPELVDVWTGSLSKALGSQGGYVAGSAQLIRFLRHEAAPYVFSGALAPAATGAALAALDLLANEPGRLDRLRANAAALRTGLRGLGRVQADHPTAIIPLCVGEEVQAWNLSRRLLERGVVASAVVRPAVPRGRAILRLCAMASHTSNDIADGLDAIARSLEECTDAD